MCDRSGNGSCIRAAAAYYRDSDHVPIRLAQKPTPEEMRRRRQSNPADTEVQVFYALSLVATAAPKIDRTRNRSCCTHTRADLSRPSGPPGVAHYLIHAYDSSDCTDAVWRCTRLSRNRAFRSARLAHAVAHLHATGPVG